MAADYPIQTESQSMPTALARRHFLRGIGWALLPGAAIGLSSCTAPHYDRDRGVFVMRPKK
jgi:hypothetical protein